MTLPEWRANPEESIIIEGRDACRNFMQWVFRHTDMYDRFPLFKIGEACRIVAMRVNGPPLDGYLGTVHGRRIYARYP